jgi:hypothetical protein
MEEGSIMEVSAGSSTARRAWDAILMISCMPGVQHCSEEPLSPGEVVDKGKGSRLEQLMPEHGVRRSGADGPSGSCPDPETINKSNRLRSIDRSERD